MGGFLWGLFHLTSSSCYVKKDLLAYITSYNFLKRIRYHLLTTARPLFLISSVLCHCQKNHLCDDVEILALYWLRGNQINGSFPLTGYQLTLREGLN